ncbi:MAG TPA: elongation factor G, partial [Porphyromonadaceae bacterium]|nr:elongation factor G [Porphyromonadaceae bacterium]
VTDLAVMLIDATSGVEVGTINQFRQIESLDKPLMFVMNRIDHEKADFENTITNLKEFYGNKVTPIQYPTGSGLAFDGIVDVLKQKLYKWKPGATAPDVLEIPDSEKEKAGEYYQVLLEAAAENDETLMEKYFDQGTLSEEEMLEGIQKGMISRDLFPVFCVSAEKNMAVHRLMNFLTLAAPSPDQVPSPQNSDGETVEPDPGALTSLFFFKTTVEPHIGEVSYFKVMSGKVKEGDDLTNTNRSSKERIAQMYLVAGQMRNKVEELQAGSIAAA